jgi:hypothetical protein
VTLPLTEVLKISETYRSKEPGDSAIWEWTLEAKLAFHKLKKTFTEAPTLQYFYPDKVIILQMDTSGFAIAAILNQYDLFVVLRPVNFDSWECSPDKQN